MTLAEARVRFVEPFDLSATRPRLFDALVAFVDTLRTAGVTGTLWLDGSFVTEKINPNDIDLVMFVALTHFEALPHAGRLAVQSAGEPQDGGLDNYLSVDYPAGHAKHRLSREMRAYWWRQFSRGEPGDTGKSRAKGIAVVEFGPGAA